MITERSKLSSKLLKYLAKDPVIYNPINRVYYHLFTIVSTEILNRELDYLYNLWNGDDEYFGEYGKEQWFTVFHKSIRQTDFFQDCTTEKRMSLLSKDEYSKYKNLKHNLLNETIPKRDKNDEITKEYAEYLGLLNKHKREIYEESISGNLDMILYQTINCDNKEYLYNIMTNVFEDYKDGI